jgi:hypothetical protein
MLKANRIGRNGKEPAENETAQTAVSADQNLEANSEHGAVHYRRVQPRE